ncbi:universal stress protein [Halorubellus sp. JP-L1]|uniref:universal stress protein n=1 Tax=Halorubellus sp. JP-L1 TaxID=2715753 RepID=UPI00140C06D2|nr:universal stress protein [Halorubellus sp. JP-L1]NHN41276.1 universal stress protein [Halorubellus sp. JP-L1]
MSSHVLVAYDDSPQAEQALSFAREAFPDADLTLLTVIDPADAGSRRRLSLPPLGDEWLERAREDAREHLTAAVDRVEDPDRSVQTAIEIGRPTNAVVDYADAHDVDHVVMGSHGRSGVTRILLGSVAESVIRRSPVPVTVTRGKTNAPEDSSDGTSENGPTGETPEGGPA